MATFADTATRLATVPSYLGQIGVQRDDNTSWIATALTAGAWIRGGDNRIVRTSAELDAALLLGGKIGITGTITRTTEISVTVAETELYSIPDALGNKGKIVREHINGQALVIIRPLAKNIGIYELEITSNHPLTSETAWPDIAICTFGDLSPTDTSGLIVEGCDIHHVGNGIQRAAGVGANPQNGGRIINNKIHAFCGYGIYIAYETLNLLIDNNVVLGRDAGQTHAVLGNCIWVGNGCDYTIITRNRCGETDRNIIELFNSIANGNLNCQITFNQCRDASGVTPGCGIGISAVGNVNLLVHGNQIDRAKTLGLELIGDAENTARIICTDNAVRDTGSASWQVAPSVGISIDGVVNSSIVARNHVGKVLSIPGLESAGVQFIHGCSDVLFSGNDLVNSGTRMVWVNGNGVAVFTRLTISDNVLFYNPDYASIFGSFTYWPAIDVTYIGVATVKNNTVYYPAALAGANYGIMVLELGGTVYAGGGADAPVTASGTNLLIEGSNIRIPY